MAHHLYSLLDHPAKMDIAPVRGADLNVTELFSGREQRKKIIPLRSINRNSRGYHSDFSLFSS